MSDVPVLLADGSLWPIIIFAILAILFGGGKKKTGRTTAPPPEGGGGGGLMSELARALEELKRAEREAAQGSDVQLPLPQAPTVTRTTVRMQGGVPRSVKGGELVRRQVFVPKPKATSRAGRFARAAAPDPDQAFEDPAALSLEQRDYDDEAEKIIKARESVAARRAARREESVEGLSAEQKARRADRDEAQPIGGKAEHDAWHTRRDEVQQAPETRPVASRLSRFGGTRMRDAVILAEILGKPVGQR